MLVMPNLQRANPRHTGTITAIVQGIAVVDLDGGRGTVKFHPSAWQHGHTDEAIYRVGDRVEVLGGSPTEQAESVWRA
jgi:membrane protein implicated in regulation of membrane protease activity